jgi:hypothetical protein
MGFCGFRFPEANKKAAEGCGGRTADGGDVTSGKEANVDLVSH